VRQEGLNAEVSQKSPLNAKSLVQIQVLID
jgi:hypothetical protein